MLGPQAPPSSFESEYYDPETQQGLHSRGLRRTQSLHDRIARTAAERFDSGPHRLKRAQSDIRSTLASALRQTTSLKTQLSLRSGTSAKDVLTAIQKAASGDVRQASAQVDHAWRNFARGPLAHAIARTLVCIFFLDKCYAKYKDWEFYQADFWQDRIARYPHRYKDPGFPVFALLVTVPCALATILGVHTRLAAGVLFVDMLRETAGIIAVGIHDESSGIDGAFHAPVTYSEEICVPGSLRALHQSAWSPGIGLLHEPLPAEMPQGMRASVPLRRLRVFQHRIEPDELTAKHVAMLGSALLVLAHAMRDRYATANTVAGLLIGEPDGAPSRAKSLLLLLGRLALTLLFLTVGISQARRVIRRDWAMAARREFLRSDGHDNNFLLLEAALAVPLAAGYRTRLVTPALALTLLAEAAFCWSPLERWPSVQYQSHVRSHFATNLGAAGGLLLLQTYGAGRYTMDGLMRSKKLD